MRKYTGGLGLFERVDVGSEIFLGEALATYRFIDKANGCRMIGYRFTAHIDVGGA